MEWLGLALIASGALLTWGALRNNALRVQEEADVQDTLMRGGPASSGRSSVQRMVGGLVEALGHFFAPLMALLVLGGLALVIS